MTIGIPFGISMGTKKEVRGLKMALINCSVCIHTIFFSILKVLIKDNLFLWLRENLKAICMRLDVVLAASLIRLRAMIKKF